MQQDSLYDLSLSWSDAANLQRNPQGITESSEQKSLTNQAEPKSFIATALAWRGSITPRVLPRVAIVAAYAMSISFFDHLAEEIALSITPFEYSGAVLALILVMRLNAGHDRWWEARKIWGGIVNQSRNLALVIFSNGDRSSHAMTECLGWIAAWPYVMRDYLRRDPGLREVAALIGLEETQNLRQSAHSPMYVGFRIASLLAKMRQDGLDPFAFQRAETERSQLIDAIGGCERIRNTQMPLVLAIIARRFILFFLLLLPFALVDRVGLLTPLIVALVAYPLFSLDEIGAELQNPFSPRNVSHLPLTEICAGIENSVLTLLRYKNDPK